MADAAQSGELAPELQLNVLQLCLVNRCGFEDARGTSPKILVDSRINRRSFAAESR